MKNVINFPLLTSEDIEVKVKQVTKTGALLLLYKTSRTDAKILDQTVGCLNWTDEYVEVKGNLYCRIGIRANEDSPFVYKMDCGIESGQDDGQEKKAEASDAFKRACSKLGIGRELYTSPQIWASVATDQRGDKWFLKDPHAKYVVTHIAYNEETRVITELTICNANSNAEVFSWKMSTSGAMADKMVKTISAGTPDEEKKDTTKKAATSKKGLANAKAETSAPAENISKAEPKEEPKAPEKAPESVSEPKPVESPSENKKPLKELVQSIGAMVKKMMVANGNVDAYKVIVKEASGVDDFKCNKATEAEYDIIAKIYNMLVAGGYDA